jgi:hypothetical protein
VFDTPKMYLEQGKIEPIEYQGRVFAHNIHLFIHKADGSKRNDELLQQFQTFLQSVETRIKEMVISRYDECKKMNFYSTMYQVKPCEFQEENQNQSPNVNPLALKLSFNDHCKIYDSTGTGYVSFEDFKSKSCIVAAKVSLDRVWFAKSNTSFGIQLNVLEFKVYDS